MRKEKSKFLFPQIPEKILKPALSTKINIENFAILDSYI
jgi:hypothetical protein